MAFKVGSTTVVDDNGKVSAAQLDITNATAETSIQGADEVLVFDSSAGAIRKATITNSALVAQQVQQGLLVVQGLPEAQDHRDHLGLQDQQGQPDQTVRRDLLARVVVQGQPVQPGQLDPQALLSV